jgi:protein involved in polysaccharide export with SLBB domain
MRKNIKQVARLLLFVLLFNVNGLVLAETGTAPASGAATDYFVGDSIMESQYKLGPGDKVQANLLVGDNALTMKYDLIVGPDGKIFFSKVGEMDLLGLTVPQAKQLIDEKISSIYKEKYVFSFRLTEPRQIKIYLSGSDEKVLYVGEKKYVSVYGEVLKSGRFEFLPGQKFSDYISFAGGPTPRANLSWCTVTRNNKQYAINGSDVIFGGEMDKDMTIMPGDVINVPAQFIYFTDLGSFASTIFTALALYNTFKK